MEGCLAKARRSEQPRRTRPTGSKSRCRWLPFSVQPQPGQRWASASPPTCRQGRTPAASPPRSGAPPRPPQPPGARMAHPPSTLAAHGTCSADPTGRGRSCRPARSERVRSSRRQGRSCSDSRARARTASSGQRRDRAVPRGRGAPRRPALQPAAASAAARCRSPSMAATGRCHPLAQPCRRPRPTG